MTLIGARVPRVEDARFLQGRGRYVADLARPGILHVAFVRSPHAHARIRRIDVTRARAHAGVIACVTGEELARTVPPVRAESRMRGYLATDYPALAHGKVRFAGEAVAAVVAESRYLAEDAAEEVDVDWEPLDVVRDAEAALRDGSPLVHEAAGSNGLVARTFAQGDADAALASASLVVGDRFRFNRHAGVAIENRACLAEWDAGAETLTLWSSTQVPGLLRDLLAELLGLPAHRVRVVAPDVGGGFGVKSALYPEEIVVCALARRLGRPIKWVGDRREDLLTSTQAWDEVIHAELGVNADGTIAGLRARVVADIGAYSIYPWTASIEVIQVISFLPGPYRVPHYRGEGIGVATNKAPMGPYRGVGRPVSAFVTESLLDRAARRLGLDPVEIRRRNMIRPEECPYRSPSGVVWDTATFQETLELACARADYRALRAEQAEARAAGRHLGIGVASLRGADRRRIGHPRLPRVDRRDGHRGRDPARGPGRHRHRLLRTGLPRPGPRDEPRPGRRGGARACAWPTCGWCTATPRRRPPAPGPTRAAARCWAAARPSWPAGPCARRSWRSPRISSRPRRTISNWPTGASPSAERATAP